MCPQKWFKENGLSVNNLGCRLLEINIVETVTNRIGKKRLHWHGTAVDWTLGGGELGVQWMIPLFIPSFTEIDRKM